MPANLAYLNMFTPREHGRMHIFHEEAFSVDLVKKFELESLKGIFTNFQSLRGTPYKFPKLIGVPITNFQNLYTNFHFPKRNPYK